MARALTDYARLLIRDPALVHQLGVPVLWWEAPPDAPDEQLLLRTEVKGAMARPTGREPLVFEVRKSEKTSNAFSMGVTVGRTENNDVVISDHSVSRFHAYLQQKASGWVVVDAESKNGSWLDGAPLPANQAVALRDGARLRLGEVELVFLEPATFAARLQQMMTGDART